MLADFYATEDDLSGWLSDAGLDMPANPAGNLRSAALIVARACGESLYADGTVITDPKRDATCAQVASWVASGVTPGAGGLAGPYSTAPLKLATTDGSTVEYDTSLSSSAAALAVRTKLTDDLCAEAEAILEQAGVLWVPVALSTGPPVARLPIDDGLGMDTACWYGPDGEPYFPGGTY